MDNIFTIDNEIEEVLKLIENDKSVINKLSVKELEILDEYLSNKKQYLTEEIGEE